MSININAFSNTPVSSNPLKAERDADFTQTDSSVTGGDITIKGLNIFERGMLELEDSFELVNAERRAERYPLYDGPEQLTRGDLRSARASNEAYQYWQYLVAGITEDMLMDFFANCSDEGVFEYCDSLTISMPPSEAKARRLQARGHDPKASRWMRPAQYAESWMVENAFFPSDQRQTASGMVIPPQAGFIGWVLAAKQQWGSRSESIGLDTMAHYYFDRNWVRFNRSDIEQIPTARRLNLVVNGFDRSADDEVTPEEDSSQDSSTPHERASSQNRPQADNNDALAEIESEIENIRQSIRVGRAPSTVGKHMRKAKKFISGCKRENRIREDTCLHLIEKAGKVAALTRAQVEKEDRDYLESLAEKLEIASTKD